MESISSDKREVVLTHGYFDIDVDIISEVINEDLQPLLKATVFLIDNIK